MTAVPTTLLLILDGWGHREEPKANAIHAARTPVWDRLWAQCPRALIDTSGPAVGLPPGQMGNSEVGHMNLGAGRVVYQSLTRIDQDIASGGFQANPVLLDAIAAAAGSGGAVHVLGLLSPGGIHSHESQLAAMVDLALARGSGSVFVHAFLDGRDTPPRSAGASLRAMDERLRATGRGRVASICGRFYAMDRDERWERIQPAYELLTLGAAPYRYDDVAAALAAAYARGEDDEFVQATAVGQPPEPPGNITDGDAVVFMNFRADRARQLTRSFLGGNFTGFTRRARPRLAGFATLTQYAADLEVPCAYPPQRLDNGLGEYLAAAGKSQLRIAETEKYAHVTFFFNGGREEPFANEERILVPSPKVRTYDLKPEMSVFEVTGKLVEALRAGQFDAVVCNFANGDMVGHTGDFAAAVQAVEAVDQCLGRLEGAIKANGGDWLITADHGNAELMIDPDTGGPLTSHTRCPVPLVHVGARAVECMGRGSLCDIAPTMLTLMGLPVPAEMTGKPLLRLAPRRTTGHAE